MFPRKKLAVTYAYLFLFGCLQAQIFAPAASYSFNAVYDKVTSSDKVFVFNRPAYQAEVIASIVAVSVDSTTGWTFQWSVFDPADTSYHAIGLAGSGLSSEIDTISISSGYQVEISKGTERDTFRVWLIFNDLDLKITNKDSKNKLEYGYYTCKALDLYADTTKIPLYYYHPDSGDQVKVVNSYLIRWTTDNVNTSNPARFLITRVNTPPYDDTWYILTVTDNFNLQRKDSVFYETIQTKADLSAKYVSLNDSSEYPDNFVNYDNFYDSLSHSAPGKYRFDISASKNVARYEIIFGDGDTLISSLDDTLIVVHEYKKPGNYKVVLTTLSAENCKDSISSQADEIVLEYAKGAGGLQNFVIPNVFTPNADNQNDKLVINETVPGEGNNVFRTGDVSVLTIDITIFDRAGHKVHSYAGSIREWEGWNGLIKDSNRQAPEGVYFYVITLLTAYEDKEYPISDKVKSGYFHLYRK
jgi:hypothetical protein